MDTQIQELQSLLDNSRYTVVITGAGVSVASGISSMHGLNMTDMFQFISKTVLKTTPKHYYKVARSSFLDAMFNNGPSLTHKKLAALEASDKVHGIITTNLDGLHGLAGSKNVAEIQGSFGVNTCLSCGNTNNDIHIWNKGEAPRCECGGLYCCYPVYSRVGILQEDAHKARDWVGKADLIIAVGAEGNYGSVYWNNISPTAKVVQINPKDTPFDSISHLNIRRNSDEVFEHLR